MATVATKPWTKGDSVIHSGKPEWGVGQVLSSEGFIHDGKPAQRVTIRFARAGTKTISTAFAELRSSSDMPRIPDAGGDPLSDAANAATIEQVMLRLPERACDPFLSLSQRLQATLDAYKFADGGKSLLDWAAIQTGLKDPLARFNRHELEHWLSRYVIELDNHLRKVVRDVKRQDPSVIQTLAASANPAARQALRRAESLG